METTPRHPQHGTMRHPNALVAGVVGCVLLASACALPVTVKRGDPETVQRELTGYVLTTGELSHGKRKHLAPLLFDRAL